jgi:hypothetical protein
MQVLTLTIFGVTNSGTSVNIDSPFCYPGEVWKVIEASLMNSSGEPVEATFGKVATTGFVQTDIEKVVGDGDGQPFVTPTYLGETEFIRCSVLGNALAGKVILRLGIERYSTGQSNPGQGGKGDPA